MAPIAIVPRPGHEIRMELDSSITCLKNAGIEAHNAVVGRAFALLWVEGGNILLSIETLRNAGFQATALTETDLPH
jgi:hypothetical protein